jgi:hypothetical protein
MKKEKLSKKEWRFQAKYAFLESLTHLFMAIRSLGRPQTRWENDVKNDLNIMKIYNWKDCIQDRHKWKKIVEKAKTFNG